MAWRVDQHEQTALDTTDQFIAVFTIAESVVLSNDSIGIDKSIRGINEVKTSHPVARTALVIEIGI